MTKEIKIKGEMILETPKERQISKIENVLQFSKNCVYVLVCTRGKKKARQTLERLLNEYDDEKYEKPYAKEKK